MTAWRLRPAVTGDYDVAKRLHHIAYRDVVVRQFGSWDESRQDALFDAGWSADLFVFIRSGATDIGYTRIARESDAVSIMEIVIHPDHQHKGIGTAVLTEEIHAAQCRRVPVRLRVLRENQARHLYARLGFLEYGRTQTHFLMQIG
jgi:ribosomal protein S18 acetylase RimI-like enzyme